MSRGAMAFLAGMGTGYLNGEKEKEKQKRQDKLDGQQDELHTARMDEIKRTQQDRTDLQVAGAPATVREMEGPQPESAYAGLPVGQEPKPLGYIAGNGTSARGFAEKGLADASATEQNKPEARRTRMADLAAQGNTLAGTALRDNVQTDAAIGQLKEQKELQGHREFARNIVGSFQKGWGGFSQFATDKFDDGNIYTATEDGKGGAVIVSTGKDGKEAGRMAFASPEEAITFAVSKADPMKWVDYKTHSAEKKADQANKDRDFGLREKDLARKTEADQLRMELARERLEASKKSVPAGAAGSGAYWSKDADEHIVKLNSFTNPETGRSEIDGNGAQFMQRVALDIAGKNGGNTMAAIARAAEVDQALKAMAKNDPAMLAQLRNKALADASAPRAQASSAPVVTSPASTARAGISPAPAAPTPTQDFNAAGYRDVQSTIDGARRGDKNALSVLQMLITRGDTTPAQRQQIANITQ